MVISFSISPTFQKKVTISAMKKKKTMLEIYNSLPKGVGDREEQEFLESICLRLSEGEHIYKICESKGLPHMVVRKWLEADNKRFAVFELARKCYAERLVWMGMDEVENAGVETVTLARLRKETYFELAGKIDRATWGDKPQVSGGGGSGGGGVTIIIGDAMSASVPKTIEDNSSGD